MTTLTLGGVTLYAYGLAIGAAGILFRSIADSNQTHSRRSILYLIHKAPSHKAGADQSHLDGIIFSLTTFKSGIDDYHACLLCQIWSNSAGSRSRSSGQDLSLSLMTVTGSGQGS